MKAKKKEAEELKKNRQTTDFSKSASYPSAVVQKAALQKNVWFMERAGYLGSMGRPTTYLTQPDGVGDRIVWLKGC